ncbi:unnamed protein product [Scytosiphon promiscuus]
MGDNKLLSIFAEHRQQAYTGAGFRRQGHDHLSLTMHHFWPQLREAVARATSQRQQRTCSACGTGISKIRCERSGGIKRRRNGCLCSSAAISSSDCIATRSRSCRSGDSGCCSRLLRLFLILTVAPRRGSNWIYGNHDGHATGAATAAAAAAAAGASEQVLGPEWGVEVDLEQEDEDEGWESYVAALLRVSGSTTATRVFTYRALSAAHPDGLDGVTAATIRQSCPFAHDPDSPQAADFWDQTLSDALISLGPVDDAASMSTRDTYDVLDGIGSVLTCCPGLLLDPADTAAFWGVYDSDIGEEPLLPSCGLLGVSIDSTIAASDPAADSTGAVAGGNVGYELTIMFSSALRAARLPTIAYETLHGAAGLVMTERQKAAWEAEMALVLIQLGRLGEAAEVLKGSLNWDVVDPRVLQPLGAALVARGAVKEGFGYLETAAELQKARISHVFKNIVRDEGLDPSVLETKNQQEVLVTQRNWMAMFIGWALQGWWKELGGSVHVLRRVQNFLRRHFSLDSEMSFLLGRELSKRGFEREALDHLTSAAAPWNRQIYRIRAALSIPVVASSRQDLALTMATLDHWLERQEPPPPSAAAPPDTPLSSCSFGALNYPEVAFDSIPLLSFADYRRSPRTRREGDPTNGGSAATASARSGVEPAGAGAADTTESLYGPIGRLFSRLCPDLGAYVAPWLESYSGGASLAPYEWGGLLGEADGRVRVVFVSSRFGNHPTTKALAGLMRLLPRQHFEVILGSWPTPSDEWTEEHVLGNTESRSVNLVYNRTSSLQRLANRRADVVVFADAPLDAKTYFLSFGRVAPIALWGNAPTLGIDSIDYYVVPEPLAADAWSGDNEAHTAAESDRNSDGKAGGGDGRRGGGSDADHPRGVGNPGGGGMAAATAAGTRAEPPDLVATKLARGGLLDNFFSPGDHRGGDGGGPAPGHGSGGREASMSRDRRRKCGEAFRGTVAEAAGGAAGAREGATGETVEGSGGGRSGLRMKLGVAAAAGRAGGGEGTSVGDGRESDDDDFDEFEEYGGYGDDDDDDDDDRAGGVDYELFVDEFGNAFDGEIFIDEFGNAFDSEMFSDEFRNAFDGVYEGALFDDDVRAAGEGQARHSDGACDFGGEEGGGKPLPSAEASLRRRSNAKSFDKFGRGEQANDGDRGDHCSGCSGSSSRGRSNNGWPEPWASVDYGGTVEEQVVFLESLGAFVTPPGWGGRLGTGRLAKLADASEVRRRHLLPETASLVVLPIPVYHFHPDFDVAVAMLLERDRSIHVIVAVEETAADALSAEGEFYQHDHLQYASPPLWTEKLRSRLAATLGDNVWRVHLLPPLDSWDYFAILAMADVVLDPFPVGNLHAAVDAFALGTPVVTLPSRQRAGARYVQALASDLGVPPTCCAAADLKEYVDLAARLCLDDYWADEVSELLYFLRDWVYLSPKAPRATQQQQHQHQQEHQADQCSGGGQCTQEDTTADGESNPLNHGVPAAEAGCGNGDGRRGTQHPAWLRGEQHVQEWAEFLWRVARPGVPPEFLLDLEEEGQGQGARRKGDGDCACNGRSHHELAFSGGEKKWTPPRPPAWSLRCYAVTQLFGSGIVFTTGLVWFFVQAWIFAIQARTVWLIVLLTITTTVAVLSQGYLCAIFVSIPPDPKPSGVTQVNRESFASFPFDATASLVRRRDSKTPGWELRPAEQVAASVARPDSPDASAVETHQLGSAYPRENGTGSRHDAGPAAGSTERVRGEQCTEVCSAKGGEAVPRLGLPAGHGGMSLSEGVSELLRKASPIPETHEAVLSGAGTCVEDMVESGRAQPFLVGGSEKTIPPQGFLPSQGGREFDRCREVRPEAGALCEPLDEDVNPGDCPTWKEDQHRHRCHHGRNYLRHHHRYLSREARHGWTRTASGQTDATIFDSEDNDSFDSSKIHRASSGTAKTKFGTDGCSSETACVGCKACAEGKDGLEGETTETAGTLLSCLEDRGATEIPDSGPDGGGVLKRLRDEPVVRVSELPDVCAICLGQYAAGEEVHVLPCLHIFHAQCLDVWIVGHPSCPYCKGDLNVLPPESIPPAEGPATAFTRGVLSGSASFLTWPLTRFREYRDGRRQQQRRLHQHQPDVPGGLGETGRWGGDESGVVSMAVSPSVSTAAVSPAVVMTAVAA